MLRLSLVHQVYSPLHIEVICIVVVSRTSATGEIFGVLIILEAARYLHIDDSVLIGSGVSIGPGQSCWLVVSVIDNSYRGHSSFVLEHEELISVKF